MDKTKVNKWWLLALLIPIVALAWQVCRSLIVLNTGQQLVLPITGFDPRNLLAGHYLTYQIDYGFGNSRRCSNPNNNAYICLNQIKPNQWQGTMLNRINTEDVSSYCQVLIKGTCSTYGIFSAGIERFYIPEQYAQVLDRKVRDKQGKLVLKVRKDGTAVVKDLLIEDQSWRDFIKSEATGS